MGCDNILKMIEGVKSGKFEAAEDYHKLYLKIMNKPEVYIKEA